MARQAPDGDLGLGLRELSTRRELLAGGLLVSAALAAEAMRVRSVKAPVLSGSRLEELVPSRVGGWARAPFAGVSIPTGETAEKRSYDAVLTRFYESSSGPGIMLLIAYSARQAGETALHRPEVCYPAYGFQLRRWPDMQLSFPHVRLMASSMTATASERVEQLLYWSRIGALFPTTSLDQRWAALKQSVAGRVPDGALLRISTVDGDYHSAVASLQQFASQLLFEGGAGLRLLLTGRT